MKNQKKSDLTLHLKTKTKHSAKRAAARKLVRHHRPLHRHVILSPLSIFAMMCVGVLLASFTIDTAALTLTSSGSYTVTATKPAPPLTEPAVVTSPTDGTKTSTQMETMTGTCPDNSYVTVTDNNDTEGSVTCSSQAYNIDFDLYPGTNYIQPQDYNVTNSPGPASTGVTVTYTPPPPPPTPPQQTSPQSSNTSSNASTSTKTTSKIAVPTELIVTEVDLGVPLEVTNVENISYQPTFAGVAPPLSRIYIVIHSNVFTCDTTADSQGYWSCTLPDYLPSEVHHIDVSAQTPQGKTLTYPEFEVKVTGQAPSTKTTAPTFKVSSNYTYAIYNVGQTVSYDIHITGGQPPYAFTVLWGDGTNSTIVRQDSSDFTISHKYGWIDALTKTDTLKVQGISADGQASTLQYSVPIRNLAYHSAVANATKSTGLWGLFNALRPWLWLLWPGYVIIILLTVSFWLGEREEMRRLMSMNRIPPVDKHHHLHFHR